MPEVLWNDDAETDELSELPDGSAFFIDGEVWQKTLGLDNTNDAICVRLRVGWCQVLKSDLKIPSHSWMSNYKITISHK